MRNKQMKILLVLVGLMVVFALAVPVQAGPPPKYLHAKGGLIDLAHPQGTDWHELYPVFCTNYTLDKWEDNGDGVLSPCDQILMHPKPDGAVEPYHVENVTITLLVSYSDLPPPRSPLRSPGMVMYIELEGGYNPTVLRAPNCTYWHEISPVFCTRYHLLDWKDNGSGELDFCDSVLLENKHMREAESWHVEDVAIVVSPAPPVGGEAYPVSRISVLAPWIAVAVLLAGGTSWYVLRRRRARS
jgi:hypothetical protein